VDTILAATTDYDQTAFTLRLPIRAQA